MKLPSLLLLLPLLAACSSESETKATPPPCNQDPWQCPAGQTCWPVDTTGRFACLNSAAGVNKGDECANTLGAPTCGDGLACFQAVGDAKGRCVAYCDPAKAGRGCAAGETCATAQLSGTNSSFMICASPTAPADAGTDTGPAADAEADTGAAADSAADASSD